MSETVMLNIRIDKSLKDHGMQVLNAQGLSTTSLIRRVFEYMEANQDIPECLKDSEQNKYVNRRKLLRSVANMPHKQASYDPLDDKHARKEAKYQELFA